MIRVLVLSDTHNRLPERLEQLAEAVDEIWHLGDVCRPDLLDAVKALGPAVTLVRGNCDDTLAWPLVRQLQRNGVHFQLVHIPPDAAEPGVDVLLHGHTHVPRDEVLNGVRYLNPGCVTRPNRGAPASVAYLTISPAGKLTWELVRLERALRR